MMPESPSGTTRLRGPARSPAVGLRHRRSRGHCEAIGVNLTDAESRLVPVAGGGLEQCYDAQAAVATDSLLVVVTDVAKQALTQNGKTSGDT